MSPYLRSFRFSPTFSWEFYNSMFYIWVYGPFWVSCLKDLTSVSRFFFFFFWPLYAKLLQSPLLKWRFSLHFISLPPCQRSVDYIMWAYFGAHYSVLTRWAWVWVNSGSWWWTGRPGMLPFMGAQRVGHDWASELNWTDSVPLVYVSILSLTQHSFNYCSSILGLEVGWHQSPNFVLLLPVDYSGSFAFLYEL